MIMNSIGFQFIMHFCF